MWKFLNLIIKSDLQNTILRKNLGNFELNCQKWSSKYNLWKKSANFLIWSHCIPLQGSTGFLLGFLFEVFPQLHALAVYRVWRVKFHWNALKYMNSIQELVFHIYIHVYVFITGISLFFEKQQHRILGKQGKPCK